MSYTFKERYLFDASARLDGSSKFGKKQQQAPFWSVGAGWQMHKESFIPSHIFSDLKLTGNIGTVGSTTFQAYQALTRYEYNQVLNYHGLLGAGIKAIGNDYLQWQTTYMRSIALNMGVLKNRVVVNFNYYSNLSKDAVNDLTLAPSSGFMTYTSNVGSILNAGYDFRINVRIISSKDLQVGVSANGNHNKNEIKEISDGLDAYNQKVLEKQQNDSEEDEIKSEFSTATGAVLQFYEGKSMYSIYAVPSLGIDPITGREVYINRKGEMTYDWNALDQVEVGQDNPTLSGSLGFYVTWKQLSLNTSFRYKFGGQSYNSTVVNRVENANLEENVDKRVFEERWREPGDITSYKGIDSKYGTFASSRFVQDENLLQLKSLQVKYDFKTAQAKKLGLAKLRCSVNFNDVFYLSTIKQERGLTYPFARTISFSLNAGF